MSEPPAIAKSSAPVGPRRPAYVDPPDWLLRAVAAPTTSHFADCDGTRLHYRCWNARETAKPVLLFAHGYKGHSHWWDFVAPWFVDDFRVVAMDFAGMGRSGHRPVYTAESFTEDLICLLESAVGPATVVGHSYGGLCTLRACAERPELIRHAIILDTRVRFADLDGVVTEHTAGSSGRIYADYDSIRARYRVIPDQPLPIHDTFEHVAFHSIAPCENGWRWRFDPALPFAPSEPDGGALLDRIDLPVDYVYGEQSAVVAPGRAHRIASRLRRCRGAIGIPQGHHHLMLDQPIAVIAVLRALLAERSR
jgi:pimeloyl-ACP methyl ester carboxylesterase